MVPAQRDLLKSVAARSTCARERGRVVWYWYLALFIGLIILGVVFMIWLVLRSIAATVNRAETIHSSIQAGMTADQVHEALSERDVCICSVFRDGKSGRVHNNMEEFIRAMREGASGSMRIHILGSTPYRVSFTVTFDSPGTVSEKSSLKGWD